MEIVPLKKGLRVDLTKSNPGVTKYRVGLGWDTNNYDGGHEFDLDVVAFLLDKDGLASSAEHLIYYRHPSLDNQSIELTGDNRTGKGSGDDESILIDLSKIPEEVDSIAFAVAIHEAEIRNQNFGMVENAYIHILNQDTDEELILYDLGEDFSLETAVVAGKLYRKNGEWKFNAIGSGVQGGLGALCVKYGLAVN